MIDNIQAVVINGEIGLNGRDTEVMSFDGKIHAMLILEDVVVAMLQPILFQMMTQPFLFFHREILLKTDVWMLLCTTAWMTKLCQLTMVKRGVKQMKSQTMMTTMKPKLVVMTMR